MRVSPQVTQEHTRCLQLLLSSLHQVQPYWPLCSPSDSPCMSARHRDEDRDEDRAWQDSRGQDSSWPPALQVMLCRGALQLWAASQEHAGDCKGARPHLRLCRCSNYMPKIKCFFPNRQGQNTRPVTFQHSNCEELHLLTCYASTKGEGRSQSHIS